MELSSTFRDRKFVERIKKKIHEVIPREQVKICHVCGTHEWTITHSGIRSLLPENVSLIAGPGCPVCIVPAREIDEAVWLAENGVTVVTFDDMFRDPGSEKSLSDAKSRGADVRVVYSVRDALELARKKPENKFVFFAIGFETTTPMNALEVSRCPENMSFLTSHRVIPPAMDLLAEMDELQINGLIAPGHVSTIIGTKAYTRYPEEYRMPTVIAGFEATDVLMSVYMILKQIRDDDPKLENEYSRAVTYEGNVKAQEIVKSTFEVVDGTWRGLGVIPSSTLQLKEAYSNKDARRLYDIDVGEGQDMIEVNVGVQEMVERSYYEDWEGPKIGKDPLGNPLTKYHPWNKETKPKPGAYKDWGGKYSWGSSVRWLDWKNSGEIRTLPLVEISPVSLPFLIECRVKNCVQSKI